MIDDEGLQVMDEHEELMTLALSKCYITRHSSNFDDCMQMARLAWIDGWHSFPYQPVTDTTMDAFRGYVYQRIRWRVMDFLRREISRKSHVVTLTDELGEYVSEPASMMFEEEIVVDELIERIKPLLTEEEKLLIDELFYDQLSMCEIAEKHHVSRQTIYNRRKKLQQKILTKM